MLTGSWGPVLQSTPRSAERQGCKEASTRLSGTRVSAARGRPGVCGGRAEPSGHFPVGTCGKKLVNTEVLKREHPHQFGVLTFNLTVWVLLTFPPFAVTHVFLRGKLQTLSGMVWILRSSVERPLCGIFEPFPELMVDCLHSFALSRMSELQSHSF